MYLDKFSQLPGTASFYDLQGKRFKSSYYSSYSGSRWWRKNPMFALELLTISLVIFGGI